MIGSWPRRSPEQRVLLAAILFALVGLALQLWRQQVLLASYDQGIFQQVLWNSLRGHPFESTLSSQLSAAVVHGGSLPALGYRRLGQHFTPLLLLWAPLVGLIGATGLVLVQVGLLTAAGLTLHRLAARALEPRLACRIALSFFCANAVLGPTWGNFTDLCQLPLLVFLLLLGIERSSPPLVALPALLIPLVREDTGVVLAGVGLWLLLRRPGRRWLGAALIAWGAGLVVLVTAVLMPLFSEDVSRRFMIENFGQYLGDSEKAGSLEVLAQVLRQPLLLLRELVSPPGDTLRYLINQGLPLLFVPYLAIDAWLLMGLPLLGLLLAQGSNNPLSINIRYTFLVVPGLFAGATHWWRTRQGLFASRRLRALWGAALVLSLLFTFTSNPNRSLSFLLPDSVHPWVYWSPPRQWHHGRQARRALRVIPPGASVAASTPLVPLLARRERLVRFPESIAYLDRQGEPRRVEWIAVDLAWQQHYAPAFPRERMLLEASRARLVDLADEGYEQRARADGVVVLEHTITPSSRAAPVDRSPRH